MSSHPKQEYRELRKLPVDELWEVLVPQFNQASPRDRVAQVALVRAVTVVLAESNDNKRKPEVRAWLRDLLQDPSEKIRRYAVNALPKLDATEAEEAALLTLLRNATSPREEEAVGRALQKIGSRSTLEQLPNRPALTRTRQKAEANVARESTPSRILLDAPLPAVNAVLHCRSGLAPILLDEIRERLPHLDVLSSEPDRLLTKAEDLTLRDLFRIRCFSSMAFRLGECEISEKGLTERIARVVTDGPAGPLLARLTDGPLRYRMQFHGQGHQRGTIRRITDRIYECAPNLINDARNAPWQIDIQRTADRFRLELSPRLRPDPRFAYRLGDVPAASHPPFAAALVRLAGLSGSDRVWDPFCGSGLELIEAGLTGKTASLLGTDLNRDAIDTATANARNALGATPPARFVQADFRDYRKRTFFDAHSLTAIITNPPLGRRVPIRDLQRLVSELFEAAEFALAPGGRLVLANPTREKPNPQKLQLDSQHKVDLGLGLIQVQRYLRASGHRT